MCILLLIYGKYKTIINYKLFLRNYYVSDWTHSKRKDAVLGLTLKELALGSRTRRNEINGY